MNSYSLTHIVDSFLPQVFFNVSILGILLWQWLGIAILLFACGLLAWLFTYITFAITFRLINKKTTTFSLEVLHKITFPIRTTYLIALFSVVVNFLGLTPAKHVQITAIERFLLILAFTWIIFRLVDGLALWYQNHLTKINRISTITMIPLLRRLLKTAIIVVAFLTILQNIGFDVTAIIAGLGVGGIAIALAAKKPLENLFGGAILILDQPMKVGDYCIFGSQEGTVEEIGVRSTKIRTTKRTIINVPNSNISESNIENTSVKDRTLFSQTLKLRYSAKPEQVKKILTATRKLLHDHPSVCNESSRVSFLGYGLTSLEINIRTYVLTTDYNAFLVTQEDLLLQIMDIISQYDI